MPDQILDKEGRSYSIVITEDEPHFAIQVFDRQVLVGEVKCRQEKPGVLYLRDIAIANNVVCRTINIRTKSFKQTLSYREKATNYRDRGLGSALLQFLIHYAQTKGVHSLYGKVYQQDIENNPKLLQWYQRHGFELRQPPPEDQPDVINLIYRAIAVLNPVSE